MDATKKLAEIQMKSKQQLGLITATAAKVRDWSEQSKMLTPEHVTDQFMRKRLIEAAEKMEQFLINGKVMLQTEVKSTADHGLIVKCMIDKPIENKPTIIYFAYSIDTDQLKKWLEDNNYFEGPLSFMCKGVQVTYPEQKVAPQHYHKILFSIDTEKTEENPVGRTFLDIIVKDAIFAVHRDIFSNKEWIVSRMA